MTASRLADWQIVPSVATLAGDRLRKRRAHSLGPGANRKAAELERPG